MQLRVAVFRCTTCSTTHLFEDKFDSTALKIHVAASRQFFSAPPGLRECGLGGESWGFDWRGLPPESTPRVPNELKVELANLSKTGRAAVSRRSCAVPPAPRRYSLGLSWRNRVFIVCVPQIGHYWRDTRISASLSSSSAPSATSHVHVCEGGRKRERARERERKLETQGCLHCQTDPGTFVVHHPGPATLCPGPCVFVHAASRCSCAGPTPTSHTLSENFFP